MAVKIGLEITEFLDFGTPKNGDGTFSASGTHWTFSLQKRPISINIHAGHLTKFPPDMSVKTSKFHAFC